VKSSNKPVKVTLVLELSVKEVSNLLDGMSELYKYRGGGGVYRWPNTATARLSHTLTDFLNEYPR
jgi:hypothetical protein